MMFSDPIFESLTVELKALFESDPDERIREILAVIVSQPSAERWRLQAVHPSNPLTYDLIPPQDHDISVKDAWDLTYVAREHDFVLDAEPSFEIVQDNVPDPGELGDDAVPAWFRQAVLEEESDEGEELVPDALLEGVEALPSVSEDDTEWSPKLVRAPIAWTVPPPDPHVGKSRGEGVCVAHPDSGYLIHSELFDPASGDERVRRDLERDIVDDDDIAEHPDGTHGLGTASVIMSLDNLHPTGLHVTGVAPAAEIVPLRVAKKRPIIPVPVLLSSGMRRLREAVYFAIDHECPVISISLGWLKNRSLHVAIKEAVRRNIIVCAAAGNYVGIVVWPARYAEVIAVAGCTAKGTMWRGSSRGPSVDVTAPAKKVWKAVIDDQGRETVIPSSGTSFAAATTAGIAALWLAHHGRQALLDRYQGEFTLTTVFRQLFTATCDPPPPGHQGNFGAGIVNAERLLEAVLPTLEELRASVVPLLEAIVAAPSPSSASGVQAVSETFDGRPKRGIRVDLAGILAVPEDVLDEKLAGVGEELAFHLMTNPSLRERIVGGAPVESRQAGTVQNGLLKTEPLPGVESLEGISDQVSSLELSNRLAERLR